MDYNPNRLNEIEHEMEHEISNASAHKEGFSWNLKPKFSSNPKFYDLVTKLAGIKKATP